MFHILIYFFKETLNEALCVSQAMAEFVVSPLRVPEPDTAAPSPGPYRFRNRSQVKRKPYQGHSPPESKCKRKKLHWYEMRPFDDPVLEKKRLHCLSQKIWAMINIFSWLRLIDANYKD